VSFREKLEEKKEKIRIVSINGRKNLITYLEIAENFAPKKFFFKLAMIIHKKNHS